MLRFLKYLVLAPIAVALLAFAYANRHIVSVSFDPLASGDASALSIDAPLFAVIIASVMIGIVSGGVTTWFSQGRHRRLARKLRSESEKMKADLDAAKGRAGDALARRG
jgi:uncharacterized integral membrane protein